MANPGPNSNGSQFFITHKATPSLDDVHSVSRRVVKNLPIVQQIQKGDKVEAVEFIRIGDAARNFSTGQKAFDRLLKEHET